MTPARIAAFIAGAWLTGACTSVDDIQQKPYIMGLSFGGSPQAVAECVQQRLRARMRSEGNGRYVVYDSVKGQAADGLSHYTITIGPRRGNPGGFAQWRVMAPPSSGRFGPSTVSDNAVRMYWTPVEECAKTAKPAA